METQTLPGRRGSQIAWDRFEALYRSSRDDVFAYVARCSVTAPPPRT